MLIKKDLEEKITKEEKNIAIEELFHNFIDNFEGIVFQGYQNFSTSLFHGNVEGLTGYNREDFIKGKINWGNIIHPNDKAKIKKKIKKFIASSTKKDSREYRIITKAGRVCWVLENVQKFYDKERNQVGVRGFIIDISEKKKLEENLKESEKKYRTIFEAIPDLFFLISSDSTILDYNTSEIEFYIPREKIMNSKLINFVSSELGKQTLDRISRVLTTKNPQILEYSSYMNDKNQFFEARFFYFSMNKVLLFIRDITNKKESEARLIEHAKKLETLNRIIIAGNKTEDLPSFLDEILIQTINLLNFDGGAIYFINKTTRIVEIVSVKNLSKEFIELIKVINIDQKPYDSIFIEGKPILMEDYRVFESEISKKSGFQSIASIPLVAKNHVIGAFIITSKERHYFTFQERDLLESIGRELGTVISKIKTEETLKKEELFLINVFKSIQDGVCILDKDHNILQTNPTLEKWYPHKKPLSNLKCFQLFYNKTKPCDNCILNQVFETGDPCINLTPRLADNGEILGMLEIYTFPLYNQITGNINGIIEYIRDITGQYKTEKKLKQSEEKSQSILENIKEGYFEVDLQGAITFCNKGLCEILGYSKNELIGMNFKNFVDNNVYIEIRRFFSKIYKTEIPITSFQFKVKKDYEKQIFLEISVYLRYDENNKKIGFFGLVRDITEAKKIEYMIKKQLEKLEELNKLKNEFILRISHELNTPLTSIFSVSDYILSKYKDELEGELLEMIDTINKGGMRMKNLVENLMDCYLIEYDKLNLNLNFYDIIELINKSIKDINSFFNMRSHSIKIDLPNKLILKIDDFLIQKVFNNLLSNAKKYTPPNGLISINLIEYKKYIELRIKDNGIGFTEKEKESAFKKFGKIERYGKGYDIDIEGPGLGLYIANEIIKLHNGELQLNSDGRYKGSEFIVKLNKDIRIKRNRN
ncbi:MAG: PAS domain S-box protein [Promethearchaeota archaeon]